MSKRKSMTTTSDKATAPHTSLGAPLSEHELCPDDLLAEQDAAFRRDIARMLARQGEFVSTPCPACDSTKSTPAFEKYGFAFCRCGNCATIYMSPRPSEAVMADYYSNSENYAYWAKHIFPASEPVRREKIHKPWLAKIVSFCARFGVPTGRLVEVGPGFGTFAALASQSKNFADVVAIEPTPELAAACRSRGVTVIEKRVEEIGDDVAPADVLVAFEVIEHLFRPRDFVRQARSLVRPGGLMILTCPNGQGFDIAVLGAGSQAVDAEHVNLFNPASLGQLVSSQGFEILDVSTPGRLDAEIVRDEILAGRFKVDDNPFLHRVLIAQWDKLGWPFQQFLAENGLSSHMWLVARRTETRHGG
jgi:2-polyprenyl-3-methyl-5-hydroxy-6-metoxy-1,4-benzoquinol methylase